MADDSCFCTRLDQLYALFFIKGLSRKKQLLLEIIERVGCTKSIQPRKEIQIVSVIQSLTVGQNLLVLMHPIVLSTYAIYKIDHTLGTRFSLALFESIFVSRKGRNNKIKTTKSSISTLYIHILTSFE